LVRLHMPQVHYARGVSRSYHERGDQAGQEGSGDRRFPYRCNMRGCRALAQHDYQPRSFGAPHQGQVTSWADTVRNPR